VVSCPWSVVRGQLSVVINGFLTYKLTDNRRLTTDH